MDAYRLPVDAGMQQGSPVSSGWARSIHRGPQTIQQVLREASARMHAEDDEQLRAADPVLWLRAPRPRRLLDILLRR